MRDGWLETNLEGIAEYINGYPFKPADLGENGVPVIRIKQLLDPNEPVDRTETETPERCSLRDGDIVFSWSGTLAVRIWNRGPAKLNQHLFRVVEKKGVYKGIVPLVLDHAIKELEEKSHGTTMKHITKQSLLPHKVLLPPLPEQKRIVDLISSVDSYIESLQQQLKSAKRSRNAVLHALLTAGGDNWVETTLGEVAHLNPEQARDYDSDRLIKYIDLSRVTFENGISTEIEQLPFNEAPGRARRIIKEKDVIVSTVRPYLKGFAFVGKEFDGQIASTGFCVIRAKSESILSELIWALVGSDDFVDFLIRRSTGSNYPAVRPNDISDFTFMLPPLHDQETVSKLITTFDDTIRASAVLIDSAQNLRSGLLSDLLSGEHEIPVSYDNVIGATS
jgi:type I restriction enzyme S subunit